MIWVKRRAHSSPGSGLTNQFPFVLKIAGCWACRFPHNYYPAESQEPLSFRGWGSSPVMWPRKRSLAGLCPATPLIIHDPSLSGLPWPGSFSVVLSLCGSGWSFSMSQTPVIAGLVTYRMLTWSGREQMKAGHQLFTLGQAPDKQPAKDTTTTLTEALVVSRALPALLVPPHHSPVAEEQGPDAHRKHAVACKRRRLPARHGPSRTPNSATLALSVKYLLVLPSSTGACPSSATSP